MNNEFWDYLQHLVDGSQIVIDRPFGSTHPRFTGRTYPVDYGYLSGTTAIDGGGVDLWVGSGGMHQVVGVMCTVDLLKRDTELKILLDCSDEEIICIQEFVNTNDMRAISIKRRKGEKNDLDS